MYGDSYFEMSLLYYFQLLKQIKEIKYALLHPSKIYYNITIYITIYNFMP